MNDKELLELAAKAAGIAPLYFSGLGRVSYRENDYPGGTFWNPLTDDGDALRLAVKLDLEVYPNDLGGAVATDGASVCGVCPHGNDKNAATRRAIVRAAAEIGKSK